RSLYGRPMQARPGRDRADHRARPLGRRAKGDAGELRSRARGRLGPDDVGLDGGLIDDRLPDPVAAPDMAGAARPRTWTRPTSRKAKRCEWGAVRRAAAHGTLTTWILDSKAARPWFAARRPDSAWRVRSRLLRKART